MTDTSDLSASSFIIVGETLDGKTFRPSDWPERLCGIMSAFGADHRMKYSPWVHPVSYKGKKCVYVDGKLRTIELMAYNFLQSFAKDNSLKVVDGTPDSDGEGAVCEVPIRNPV